MISEQECDLVVDRVAGILAEPGVRDPLERLLDISQRHRISQCIDRMRRKDAFVAVIGSQGSGKSSLLNSLLFTTRTLPIGEGVTTNIVCLVRDAGETEVRAEIEFESGEMLTQPLSRAALEVHMDEACNPGNHLGVARITCFTHHPLLTNTTVFVDTPGIGSVLKWQDSVTLGFVREISLAICVLRTTPPITTTEAEFLSNIWPLCPALIFVQNIWHESVTEIATSIRDNADKLARIASAHGDQRAVAIYPVNIHQGLEGVANDWPELVQASGLVALHAAIEGQVAHGGRRLEIAVQGRQIVQSMRLAIRAAEDQARAASMSDDGEVTRLKHTIEDAETRLREIKTRHGRRSAAFRRDCENAVSQASNLLDERIARVRQEFIDRTDSADLETEYPLRLKKTANSVFADFKHRLARLCEVFTDESATDIGDIFETFQFAEETTARTDDLSGTYVVEAVGQVATWGSTITLTALTVISANAFGVALAAGSTLTAAVSLGAAAVPVVGWVIAGATLTAGLLLKQGAAAKRRTTLREVINRAARETLESAAASMATEGARIQEIVKTAVEEHFKAAVAQQQKLLTSLRDGMSLSKEEKEALIAGLRRMIVDLEAASTMVERLTQFSETRAA